MPFTLYWLALGAFCIGTQTFLIAPLLPAIASELGVSIAALGQLVTIYALTYAIGSPVLSTLLGNYDRKTVLIAALAALAAVNALAAAAQSFAQLAGTQILLALAAGVFMPGANTVAAMLVKPEQRGRALAVVIGGLTVALALGTPIGALVGGYAGWRVAFLAVAAACALGVIGLISGLPRNLPRGTATLVERVAVARRPEILLALLVTFFWATGAFTFYTFVAPFLTGPIGLAPHHVPLMLFLFGVAGWVGNGLGGQMTDRRGPVRTISLALLGLTLTYAMSSTATQLGPSGIAAMIVALGFLVGGTAGWAFHPSQTARLVGLAPDGAVVALSLNQSALYLGSAAGAALGAFTVAHGSVAKSRIRRGRL